MNNKYFTILLLLISASTVLRAQGDLWDYDLYQVGRTYPGYIIKTNGEKLEGFIEAQQRGEVAGIGNSNQTRVIFYTDPKDKKTKEIFKPEDVKEYMIADKHYKAMQYSGGLMKAPVRFLLMTQAGEIAQYTWYTNTGTTTSGEYIWEGKLVFQKGDGEPKSVDEFGLKFAEKVSEWVKDYPELAAKVSNKEKGYGMVNLLAIFDEYNAWYKTNHP